MPRDEWRNDRFKQAARGRDVKQEREQEALHDAEVDEWIRQHSPAAQAAPVRRGKVSETRPGNR